MTGYVTHRLDGLEPENLLAFLALIGLLRTLEESRPDWRVRVYWTVDEPPLRPMLRAPEGLDQATIVQAAAEGLDELSQHHDFRGLMDLALSPQDAAEYLNDAAESSNRYRYTAELWAALVSNVATSRDGKKAEPTPLCLMFGQGHQHFMERLEYVPGYIAPLDRGRGRNKTTATAIDCLHESLFELWKRPDATPSFRWDYNEDVRYALRARSPTDRSTKETTQHGANRLATIGFSVLTVVPVSRSGRVQLAVLGGRRDDRGNFVLRWPIWRDPVSLAAIRTMLSHPGLWSHDLPASLGIAEIRETRRISSGRYMNFTMAQPVYRL